MEKYYLWLIPLFVGLITQTIKIIFDIISEKKFDISFFIRWWGFPSVHSSISSSITTLMGIKFGLTSPFFSIALIFSFLFWYDAMNVRYEVWRHAQIIKKLSQIYNITNKKSKWEIYNLKDRLWHTFFEVFSGIIFGVFLTILTVKLINV